MASHNRRPPFRSQITVVRSQVDMSEEVAEVKGGELGSDKAQDFTDGSLGPAPGVDTMSVFPKNAARSLLDFFTGEDMEVQVGLHNEEIGRNFNVESKIDSEMDRFDAFNSLALEIAEIVVSSKEKYEYAMTELQRLKDNLLSNIVADVAKVKLQDSYTSKRKGRPLEKRK